MGNLKINNLSKSFKDLKILDEINLEVNHGEFISLVGKSGSGKSTLLNLIAGIESVDSGTIFVNDRDITFLKPNLRDIAIVFQDYSLFPHMNVYDNIAFGLKVRKLAKSEISTRVGKMLKVIDLENRANYFPLKLSGGEKQRVALARALIIDPQILLLDEPFTGLDSHIKKTMMDFVYDIVKQLNTTTIMVTHDREEAFSMSNRVAILNDTKIIAYDSPKCIYGEPKNLSVAKFLSIFNIIDKDKGEIFGYKNQSIIINYHHIEIYRGENYKIVKKQFLGEYIKYYLINEHIELKVISTNDSFKLNEMVDIKIEKLIVLDNK
ncbi:MAG: ABC transporter ATP-binding protein [Bacilli bacterium]